MRSSQAAVQHGMNYTGPADSTLFLTLQTFCGNDTKLPEEWKELVPEMSALFVDVLGQSHGAVVATTQNRWN